MKKNAYLQYHHGHGLGSSEFLGVCGVIFVIMSGVLSYAALARDRSREAACASNVRQIVMGMNLYAHDHAGRYPPSGDDMVGPIYPYVNNLQLFICPIDADPVETLFSSYREPSMMVPSSVELSYFLVGGMATDDRPRDVLVGDTLPRHRGAANAACIDGRLRTLSADELTDARSRSETP